MVCLISGGASGIGRAAALRLAQRMPVVIADADEEAAERTAAEIRARGGTAAGIGCDVRHEANCAAAVAAAEDLGRLTDLISSAGVVSAGDGPLDRCASDVWNHVIGVNLSGAANFVRAGLPALERTGGGDIVLVASAAALLGRPGIAAYSASKAGLIGLQRSLVADFASRGIRCNCVCPGPTRTPMTRSGGKVMPNATGEMAQPDEVAAAIDWLTSDDSNWLIGGVLPLDGGETSAVAQAFFRGKA
jgi:NAD(P)-dependent dehydrogenase (short-subunit alcohol dehydrogenase family)